MEKSQSYPYFKVSGSPFELGRQHGEACREQVHSFLEHSYQTIGEHKNQDRETLRMRAESFVPSIKEFIPDAIEEMRGIAAGANVSFAEVVLLNVRTELTLGAGERRFERRLQFARLPDEPNGQREHDHRAEPRRRGLDEGRRRGAARGPAREACVHHVYVGGRHRVSRFQ